MLALTLKALEAPLELVERPDLAPGSGEVVVDVRAAALNRRDYWITQGQYPGIKPPVVLGSDAAGVVSRCGAGVDASWLGREVVINPGMNWGQAQPVQSEEFTILGLPQDGTLASQVCAPAQQLHVKPAHLSMQAAAALPLAGVTAYRALFSQGGLAAGENVLITGIGGGVALFALQFALAVGGNAWVTSSSAEKIERAIALGAAGGVNYKTEKWWKQLDTAPDLIVDGAGGNGYAGLVNVAAPGGRIVNYGSTAGPAERLELTKVFWKQLTLRGTTMGSPADFASMLTLTTDHRIRPIIDRVIPFSKSADAIELMQRSPQFGKIVISMTD